MERNQTGAFRCGTQAISLVANIRFLESYSKMLERTRAHIPIGLVRVVYYVYFSYPSLDLVVLDTYSLLHFVIIVCHFAS